MKITMHVRDEQTDAAGEWIQQSVQIVLDKVR